MKAYDIVKASTLFTYIIYCDKLHVNKIKYTVHVHQLPPTAITNIQALQVCIAVHQPTHYLTNLWYKMLSPWITDLHIYVLNPNKPNPQTQSWIVNEWF